MRNVVEAEARLRTKNQITVPEQIVRLVEVEPNDTLVFAVDPDEPGVARVRVLPRTCAGALTGTYGTTEEVTRFIREEHADWASRPEMGLREPDRVLPVPGRTVS